MATTQNQQLPIRKVHKIRDSFVVTLAPQVVKDLNIDDLTFCEQQALPDGSGIIMKLRRLTQ